MALSNKLTTGQERASMKILILGTSNSILKGGWARKFVDEAPPEWVINNKSVGASPLTQFAGWMCEDLSSYDCVLVDAIPNDENLMQFVGDTPFFYELQNQILSTIAAQTHLITLGFCNRTYRDNRSDVFKSYQAAMKRLGGTFLDVVEYALGFPEPVFLDGPHIHPDIAFKYGQELVDLLPNLILRASPDAQNYQANFAELAVSDLSDADVVSKKNSLLEDDYVRLDVGAGIDLPKQGRVIGFSIDASMSYADICFVGPNGNRRIALRYNMAENGFLAKFVPVPNGWITDRVEIMEPDDTSEAAPHNRPTDPGGRRSVALARLAIWNG